MADFKDIDSLMEEVAPTGNEKFPISGDKFINLNRFRKFSNVFAETGASDTAGRWTASIPGITELYDGLQIKIVLKTSYNSTYNTLNINGLGEQLVWYRVGQRLTSHLGSNNILNLTYYSGAGTYSTFTGGWVIDSAYYTDTVTQNNVGQFRPSAGEPINPYKIGMLGLDDKFYPFTKENSTGTTKTVQTVAFKLNSPIFWFYNSGTASLGSSIAYLNTMVYGTTLQYTLNQTFGNYTDLYLVGTANVDNNTFILDNSSYTSWCTDTLPTTDDGKAYMYLGKTFSPGSYMHLFEWHPIYFFKNGALRILNTSYISGDSHNHDYNLLDGLPAIYNANHDGVPSDDFDTLYNYQNDVWLCSHSMCNAPLDNEGNNNASYNTAFDNCVIQQFGNKDAGTKIQVLYITTGDVANLSMGYIFYRMQGDKWKRIATYSDIADLQSQIDSLVSTVNSKQDKMSETTVTPSGTSYANRYTFTPTANRTLNINCPNLQNLYVHIGFLNSLDEAVILVNNNGINGTIDVTYDANYKVAGMLPFFTVGSKWVISIFKGVLFFNQIN